ncbi:MAG: VWA domain-containing protein [Polyangiaceae bacterium]|nr:VWA domain-containing protein [Polyangiaceae bacterium]
MLVRTFGILAALGMGATSLGVWSATPAPRAEPIAQQTGGELLVAEPDPSRPPRADFTREGTLEVSARLGHPVMAAERMGETYLMVRMEAAPDFGTGARPALNLAIVIDRSGSMRGKRLTNALAAARTAIEGLRTGDVVSVITYDVDAKTLVAPVAIDEASRSRALAALRQVTPGGNTCISCALDAAEQALTSGSSMTAGEGRVNRVLLLTDGEPTRGVLDVGGFERQSERLRDRGIPISTIGVDVEYNERILAAIARASNGRHYFVEDAASLPRIFEAERQALAATVAKDAQIIVSLAPGVLVSQVYDRRYQQTGSELVIPIGALSAGEERTVLVRVETPSASAGEQRVAGVFVSYDDLVRGGRSVADGELNRALSFEEAEWSPLDSIVAARVSRSETAQVLIEANQLVASGRASDARARLGSQLAALEAKRSKLSKGEESVKKDLDRQASALAAASEGFADAPAEPAAPGVAAAPAPAAPAKKSRAQTRANAERAVGLGY